MWSEGGLWYVVSGFFVVVCVFQFVLLVNCLESRNSTPLKRIVLMIPKLSPLQ